MSEIPILIHMAGPDALEPSSESGGPTTYEELAELLRGRMDTFAPGQRRIAELLLTEPDATALRSIGQTAEIAGVHQSSLVRFATLVGLRGYPSIVALCRRHLAVGANLVSRFEQAKRSSGEGNLLSKTLEHENANLSRTLARISSDEWDATVKALAECRQVHVMGLRKCLSVAQLLAYLLRLVRNDVHQLAPVTGSLVDELRELQEGDAFVAISISRYSAETVRAFREASERGLLTIALTDTAASPLARVAKHCFLIDCDGVTVLRSVASFIVVVQALATGVALKNGTRSRNELLADESLLERFNVYD
jgi:DNA-binding MurR/RpiR family transcriptional regulator